MSSRLVSNPAGHDRATHSQVRQHILRVARELARRDGSAAVGLREVARGVGMQPQSLYTYFASKNDLYDALSVDATDDLVAFLQTLPRTGVTEWVWQVTRAFVGFGTDDPARFTLMFAPAIPHYRHNTASQAGVDQVITILTDALRRAGIDAPAADVYIAAVMGLVSQQNINQPGGTRWVGHLEQLVSMLLHDLTERPA